MDNALERIYALYKLKDRLYRMTQSFAIDKVAIDLEAIEWAIQELLKLHFERVVLIIGDSKALKNFDGEKTNVDNISVIVELSPADFEISLFRKYLIPDGYKGVEIPQSHEFLFCERVFASRDKFSEDKRALYMEGFVPKTLVLEIGCKGIRQHLRKWLVEFFNNHHWEQEQSQ